MKSDSESARERLTRSESLEKSLYHFAIRQQRECERIRLATGLRSTLGNRSRDVRGSWIHGDSTLISFSVTEVQQCGSCGLTL